MITCSRSALLYVFIAALCGATAGRAHDPITFTIGLHQRNLDILQDVVSNMSNYQHQDYGKFWSKDQILDLIAPDQNISNTVHHYFNESKVACINYRDSLVCHGDPTVALTAPSHIMKHVHIIDGLNQHPSAQSRSRSRAPNWHKAQQSPHADPGYVGVESVRKLYNITDTSPVQEDVVAVEYQGESGYMNGDVVRSQQQNGLTIKPITISHSIGDNVFPDTETALDLQMLTYANNVSLWYWGSDQWLMTWAVNFFNRPVVPYVASHSWGWAVDQQCTIIACNSTEQYVNRVNIEYLKIAARGVTMLVSSGDSGAPGRSDETCQGVNRTVVGVFPGSSPYVLSVGATYVDTASNGSHINPDWKTPLCQQNGCTVGVNESVINFNAVGWTAGGGFGRYPSELQPTWQEAAVQAYFYHKPPLPTYFDNTKRAYPDISVVGHNCPTWQSGQLSPVDGTSCSSPLMGSIIAIMNSHQRARGRPRMGLAAPMLYAMYYDNPDLFNDITTGNNWCTESMCCPVRSDGGSDYGFVAGKGFDPVTGLGTPNVGKMLEWLDVHT